MGGILRGRDRKTLRRYGGKPQTTSCRSRCCAGGECVRVRRYDRCTATPEIDGCQTLPVLLWLCERTDPPMPGTVKLYNSCYSQTETVVDTVDVPPGETVIVNILPNIAGGCADPSCTTCAQYYLAEPCPGQNVNGTPPVFVLAERVPVPGPGEDCAVFAVQWPQPSGRICYSVKPGELFNEPRVDELGGHKIVDHLSLGGKCCLCVVGCGETIVPTYTDCGLGQREINLRCCCSDEWTATISLNATVVVDQGPTVAVQTDTVSGTITQGNPAPVPAQSFIKRTTRPPFGSDPGYDSGPQPIVPPQTNHCPPALLGAVTSPQDNYPWLQWLAQNANLTHCPFGGPFVVVSPDGSRDEVVRADTYLTCNTFQLTYLHRRWEASQPATPRVVTSITLSILVRHTGICGGGCGQATGQAADPAGRLVAGLQAASERSALLEVPRERWPAWAALIAKGSTPQDKGVGDTFARQAGKVGGEQFKAATKALGLSCGCDARRDRLNALYPYK